MEPPSDDRHCVLVAPPPSGVERTPLFGLTPVERTVLAFARAGVRHFWIVGEPAEAGEVARLLRSGRCGPIHVHGVGLAPTGAGPSERFFVARTDCYYDRRMVARFVEETRDAVGPVVAVDFGERALRRGAALPRVAVWPHGDERTLRAVGKELALADGVAVGLALATSSWVKRLGVQAAQEGGWLAALAATLEREPVVAWAVREPWHALHRATDPARARGQVLAGGVSPFDGPVARYLNRPLSLRITARLLASPVKPWQVTLASFVTTLVAGSAFAIGHAATGGLLAQLAAVLDGVDGELARLRYQDSAYGGVYDALLDRVADAALIGGMTLYAWLMGAGFWGVVLGFLAVEGSSLSMLTKEKFGTQFRRPWAPEREGKLRWLLLGRDGRLFLALLAGLTGQVEAVLAYLAVGTHLHAGFRILRMRSEASRA